MLTPAPTPTFIGAFPVILGVFFMVNARTEIIDIMAPGSIPKGNKDESFFQGVMVHYMFILGIALHASGVTNLALCLGFPGPLAMIPMFTTVAAMILFMAIFRTGIAGAPQFSFPPVPGVVMLPTILATLSYNAYTNWASYGLRRGDEALCRAECSARGHHAGSWRLPALTRLFARAVRQGLWSRQGQVMSGL